MRACLSFRSLPLLCSLTAIALSPGAHAACPKNKKEWQARGPKLFLEQAAQHSSAAVEIEDFSARIGKKGGATGTATPFQMGKVQYAMVQARDADLFLSGVLKCDPQTQEPSLESLSWVKGAKSGLISLRK